MVNNTPYYEISFTGKNAQFTPLLGNLLLSNIPMLQTADFLLQAATLANFE